jgi:purine-binding chemotaxis protein CheW
MSDFSDLASVISSVDKRLSDVRREFESVDQVNVSESEEMRKYLLTGIGPLSLAVAIDDLAEVGPLPSVTFLPNLPSWIQGIVNLRSEIVSVVDFAGFLQLPGTNASDGNRFMVLRYRKRKVGIRIDRIVGTIKRGDSKKITLADVETEGMKKAFFSSGFEFDGKLYYHLNVAKFLTSPRLLDFNRAENSR